MEKDLYAKCISSRDICRGSLSIYIEFVKFLNSISETKNSFKIRLLEIQKSFSENQENGEGISPLLEGVNAKVEAIKWPSGYEILNVQELEAKYEDISSSLHQIHASHLSIENNIQRTNSTNAVISGTPAALGYFFCSDQSEGIISGYDSWFQYYCNFLASITKAFQEFYNEISNNISSLDQRIISRPVVIFDWERSQGPKHQGKDPFEALYPSSFDNLNKTFCGKIPVLPPLSSPNDKSGPFDEQTQNNLQEKSFSMLDGQSFDKKSLGTIIQSPEIKSEIWNQSLLKKYQGHNIPRIVTECVKYIYQRGLKEEGLFSCCSNKTKIVQVIQSLENKTFDIFSVDDPHIIACVLKYYVREMNDIFGPTLLMQMARFSNLNDEDKLDGFRIILKNLKADCSLNYFILKMIVEMLSFVGLYFKENKMNTTNLGKVVGISLFRGRLGISSSWQSLTCLIENYSSLFTSL
jgi:hypothetical protein